MALINASNGSSLSGLVGRVVIVNTKWGSYMRSAPQYSKSSWTGRQKTHRQRFKVVNAFCNQFKETLIAQVWNDPRERVSGHGRFLKANMPAFSAEGELTDPALVQLSCGELELEQGLQVQRLQGQSNRFTARWDRGNGGGIRWWDELMVVSMGGGIYSDIHYTGLVRGKPGGEFELPNLPENTSHLYLFFGSKDRRKYSVSRCFTVDANSTNL